MKIGNPIKTEYYFIACDYYLSIYNKRVRWEIDFKLRVKLEENVRINAMKLADIRIPPESLNLNENYKFDR